MSCMQDGQTWWEQWTAECVLWDSLNATSQPPHELSSPKWGKFSTSWQEDHRMAQVGKVLTSRRVGERRGLDNKEEIGLGAQWWPSAFPSLGDASTWAHVHTISALHHPAPGPGSALPLVLSDREGAEKPHVTASFHVRTKLFFCCASSVLLKWAFQARAHLQAVLQKPEVLYTFTTLWSASLFRTLPCNLISQYVLVRFYFSWLVSIDFATLKKKLPMFKCRENSWMRSTSPVLFRGNILHFPLWQQLMNWGAQITVDIGSSINLATHSHCWSMGWGQTLLSWLTLQWPHRYSISLRWIQWLSPMGCRHCGQQAVGQHDLGTNLLKKQAFLRKTSLHQMTFKTNQKVK